MTDYLFDSNILIDALNGVEPARTEIRRAGHAWISRITWTEVMSKVSAATARNVEIFLGGFSVAELDQEVGRRAAALRCERPKLRLPDAVILASAQVHGRILVTRNTRDFPATMPGVRIPYTL